MLHTRSLLESFDSRPRHSVRALMSVPIDIRSGTWPFFSKNQDGADVSIWEGGDKLNPLALDSFPIWNHKSKHTHKKSS